MPPTGAGRRTGVAGTIGSLLEWYDFTVYGFLAPILGKLFFPADDQVASLLAAFGVFAVGYAARPLGGVVFGHIGDTLGRKPAMIISAMIMGLATLAIGVLPDHAQIGAAAALLLVALRILQGLSLGGEFTDSVVMLAEQAPTDRRGFVASWPELGGIVGMLLGSGVGALTSSVLGEAGMLAWGWRLPFLLGAVIAVFAVVSRRQITESPALAHVERPAGSPVMVALRRHWRSMLRMVCLLLMQGIGFYMVFVYAASYLTAQMHVTTARALDINTLALLAMLVGAPAAAIASDRLGRKPILYFVVLATGILAWPLWALMHHHSFALILAGQIGFGVLMGLAFGVTPATMIEMLPAEVRCSGVAIGYNVCFGLFGGTTPLIATYLVARTADDFAPPIISSRSRSSPSSPCSDCLRWRASHCADSRGPTLVAAEQTTSLVPAGCNRRIHGRGHLEIRREGAQRPNVSSEPSSGRAEARLVRPEPSQTRTSRHLTGAYRIRTAGCMVDMLRRVSSLLPVGEYYATQTSRHSGRGRRRLFPTRTVG